uniref:Uncharacterized protein n=1 Tax=Graphocephala atropunctata TaxID=36148 RepID=A0A1B6MGS7_9HEMI
MVSVACFILFCSCIAVSRCDTFTDYADKVLENSSNTTEGTAVKEATGSTYPDNAPKSEVQTLLNGETSGDSNSTDNSLHLRSRKRISLESNESLNKQSGNKTRKRVTPSTPTKDRRLKRKTTIKPNENSEQDQTTIPTRKPKTKGNKKEDNHDKPNIHPEQKRINLTVTEDDSSNNTKPAEADGETLETKSSIMSRKTAQQKESIEIPHQPSTIILKNLANSGNYENSPYLVQRVPLSNPWSDLHIVYPSQEYSYSPDDGYYGYHTVYSMYPNQGSYSNWDNYNCCG